MRWSPILRSLSVVSGLVEIAHGIASLYYQIKGAGECEHKRLHCAHNPDYEKPHKDNPACSCKPRLFCMGCGIVIDQASFWEEDE